jgi:hypothetical protein
LLFVAVASFADLAGCMLVESPIRRVAGTEIVWGDVATADPAAAGRRRQGLRGVFFEDSRRVVRARAREIARRVPVVRQPRHAAR